MSIISLDAFRKTFDKAEPASGSRFSLDIINVPTPGSTGASSSFAAKYPTLFQNGDLRFRCQHSDIPGKAINTADYTSYGPTRKIAMNATYAPINVGIIITDSWIERKMFEDWHDLVVSAAQNSSEDTHDVNYYDDYASFTAMLTTYDKMGKVSGEYTLDEVFPLSISPTPMDWGTQNQYLIMQIELAYRMWRRTK